MTREYESGLTIFKAVRRGKALKEERELISL